MDLIAYGCYFLERYSAIYTICISTTAKDIGNLSYKTVCLYTDAISLSPLHKANNWGNSLEMNKTTISGHFVMKYYYLFMINHVLCAGARVHTSIQMSEKLPSSVLCYLISRKGMTGVLYRFDKVYQVH